MAILSRSSVISRSASAISASILLKNALWHGPNKGYRRNSRAYKNGVPDVEYISHERALRIVDELEAVGWHESAGQVAQARGDAARRFQSYARP